jgi:hypothetical protein
MDPRALGRGYCTMPYLHVKTRVRNSRTVEQAMERNGWMLDIQGSVATLGARDCIKLWLAVSSTHRNTNVEDRFLWRTQRALRII